MNQITWDDFEKVELRVGTIIKVEDFPEARKPAFKLWVDFGAKFGVKKSSAQIVNNYSKQELLNKQIIGVLNFPEKQIGPVVSQVLVTGIDDIKGEVVLATPDKKVPNGHKLY